MSAKAKLLFNRGAGQPVECLVRFNERDEIAACEASRYFSATELRLWVPHFSDYRRQQGLLVPFANEANRVK